MLVYIHSNLIDIYLLNYINRVMTVYNQDTTYNNPHEEEVDIHPTVYDGEKCTYEIAGPNNYKITKDGKFDTSIISKTDQNKINKYINDDEYEYSLCNKVDDKYYFNCALDKKNIWLTKNDANECIINENIVLPPNKIEKDQNIGILKLTKPDSFTAIKDLRYPDSTEDEYNILCSERWYDWFTIPDYHNGNKYAAEIDSGGANKCFKPCKFGSILTSDTQNLSAYVVENKNKCINRDLIDNGRLKNTLLFTPYAIIFLFGSTKNDLIDLYNYELSNIKSIVDKYNENPNKQYDYEIDNNVLKQITENDLTLDNIIDDLKITMQMPIKQLITEPISHLNIIPPHDNLSKLNNEPKKYYNNEKYIKKAYEIATKLYNYLTDISLKSDFYLWKKQLQLINGFDINSWEFNKILLLLQASCMLCFGYQNPKDILYKKQKEYNEYIMQKIFKFNDNNSVFNRINFPRITNSQVLKSIDTNNPFNNMENSTLLSIKSSKIKDFQLVYADNGENDEIPNNMTELKKCDIKFYNYNNTVITKKEDCKPSDIELCVDKINVDMIDNGFTSFLINMFNCFFVIVVIIIFIFMSYLLIILVWPSFANVINYAIFGFIWILSVFIGTFQALAYKAPNSKGIIMEIHRTALKGEFFYDQFMRTLAVIGSKNDIVFYLVFALAGAVIGAVIFKSLFDLLQIFIADSAINNSSNKSTNPIKYVFSC